MLADNGVSIAIIGMVGVVLAASIPALFLWLGQRDIKDRLGVPNGNGNISELSEKQLARQTEHDRKLAAIDEKLDAHLADSMRRAVQYGDYLRQGENRIVALEKATEQVLSLVDSRADEITAALDHQDEAAAEVKSDLQKKEQSS